MARESIDKKLAQQARERIISVGVGRLKGMYPAVNCDTILTDYILIVEVGENMKKAKV